jgi:tetratricopeptide (TPR) repeat protein
LWPLSYLIASCLILIIITVMAIRTVQTYPYLAVGWLWYLGCLVPVIGFIQIGAHAMADRYTYIPLIGLFIIISWGFHDFIKGWRYRKFVIVSMSGLILCALEVVAVNQVQMWKNSITLFEHTLNVTEGNYIIHNNLGLALKEQNRFDEAASHFRSSIQIKPDWHVYVNLGVTLSLQGRDDEAISLYRMALQMQPNNADIHYILGEVLLRKGKINEAISEYKAALHLKSDNSSLYNSMGVELIKQGKLVDALSSFREAVKLKPDHSGAHNNLAMLLAEKGAIDEAIVHFYLALQFQPNYANAHYNLALALKKKGMNDKALFHLREAVRINPEYESSLPQDNNR